MARDARYSVEPHRRYYSKFDVWWSRDGDGLHTLVNGHVRTLIAGRDLPVTSAVAILTDAPGNLLLRMTDGAVHQVTGGRTRPLNTLRLPGDVLPEAFVSVSDDELWFSAGLRDLYHFANGRLEKRSAFPTSILSLCVDREGSIWVGTSRGLHRMRGVAVVTHSEREGLSSNLVYSLLRTRGGTVWIDLFALAGAAGQIVSIALARTGGFRTVPNSRSVVMTLFAPSGAAVGTLASTARTCSRCRQLAPTRFASARTISRPPARTPYEGHVRSAAL